MKLIFYEQNINFKIILEKFLHLVDYKKKLNQTLKLVTSISESTCHINVTKMKRNKYKTEQVYKPNNRINIVQKLIELLYI